MTETKEEEVHSMTETKEEEVHSMAETKEEEEEEGTADWSNLPYDLLETIINQLDFTPNISDYAHFAAVCVSWQQAYNDHIPLILHPQLPFLMIPTPSNDMDDDDDDHRFRSFYRITDGKVYNQFKVRMPTYRHCRGSSHGWLITVDNDSNKGFPVRLFNPFLSSNNEILLPSLNHLPIDQDDNFDSHDPCNYTYLHKAVLSADPSSYPDDYMVMAIYGCRFKRLAFYRPGNEDWTPIGPHFKFEDIIYYNGDQVCHHNGRFHAVTNFGTPVSFKVADILAHQNIVAINSKNKEQYLGAYIVYRKLPSIRNKKLYLVPTLKTLLLVLRTIDIVDEDETTKRRPYATKEFKVFYFLPLKNSEQDGGDMIKEQSVGRHKPRYEWQEIHELWGHTLFIGDNGSMSVCASECPPGCKPDCIYYTDDYYPGYDPINGTHDMGIFNVKDGSFEKICPTDPTNPMWPPPIWIEPTLNKTGGTFKSI